MSSAQSHPGDDIVTLEEKSSQGCDYVIQHVLPHYLEYNGKFKKNFAMYATESGDFKDSGWPNRINMMDEAIVFCNDSKKASINSNVRIPIHVVPHAVNCNKFYQRYDKFNLPIAKDTFVFYFIGEFIRRKNLGALVKAFHSEFSPNENVVLLVKTSIPNTNPDESYKIVNKFVEEIKMGLKLYNGLQYYKPDIVITAKMTDEEVMRLHHTAHCLVIPSYQEGFGLCGLDALGMGKPVITNKIGGMKDYLDEESGWLIDNTEEDAFAAVETFPWLNTAGDKWANINMGQLKKAMREAYSDHELYTKKSEAAMDVVHRYSYENVGKKFLEILQ
jgi:glycosyltransferase involved in cell wall biosynthesis